MISERNDPGNTGAIRLVRLHSRNSFSTFENWQSKICNPLASGGVGWQRSTFGVPLSSESDRLKSQDRPLLSEHGIDPAQFNYQEEDAVQAEA